ncbi:tail fiber protein [Escherichia coli]|nr:tail fiber protein [Escherichia coli]EHL5610055.1 tail fiber protein [Escherichia coli]EIQ1174576.1 tail fiber protein [Escherichia coli]EKD0112157.1 tail fiber protein [Escherichia coli]
MSKLLFTMTDAGRQELVNANKTGTNKVEIVSVGLGSRYYVTSTSQTNITNEIKRLTTIGGKVVSPDTIHVTAKDDSKDEYVVHTIGLYTNKGTLFAVYSQEQAIINKASSTIALISSDIAIKTLDTKNITFGDIEFINPPATETVVGVARFANEQEIDAGTDDSLAVSAKRLKQAIVKHEQSRNHPDATLTSKGFVQLSSATNSTSEMLAATPKAVKAAYDLANAKYTAQDATTARKGIVQLSSATNSTSETLAATPKAVKAAYDLAAGKAPSNHTHSWAQITNVPVASLTVRGITQLSSATNSTSETLAATSKAVKVVMDETNKKAPLNSPALTGTPTTPTAPKGTNNTQIASTAYVMAAIAALVDSSPDALNTLNELAAALGNDPNFATTMTNALAGKQPKDNTLSALAGLATAADRFPYFTGNDVASLATLTKVGRDILAKSTVAAVIEYLGLQETVNQASGALQKNQNGADIPDKGRFLSNINVYSKGEVDKKKGMRQYAFNAPSNAVGGKWYPVIFRRSTGSTGELASRVIITTTSASGDYAMNNCEFNGMVMPGGWTDRGSYAAGYFSTYQSNERAIHSIVTSMKEDDVCSVFYIEGRAFPVRILAEEGLTVIVPTQDYTIDQTRYKWGATNPATESTNVQTILDFNNGRGFYCSHSIFGINAIFSGNLGIGTANALGGNSIVLGDNDTGFKQNGDGVLDAYANGVHVFRFRNGSAISLKGIQAGESKLFTLASANNSARNASFNLWGNSSRPTVAELGDDSGWHFYSQRNTDNSVIFAVNGQIQPSNWGNIDSRYVKDVRLGSQQYYGVNNWQTWNFQCPSGHVLSGINVQDTGSNSADNIAGVYYRPIQKYINGTWYNVASV